MLELHYPMIQFLIISIIIHCTHYLSSHWLRAYSEFWTSRSREVLSALAFGSAGNT